MAVSRIASSQRMCSRYKYFFYIALLILGLQLFLGYSFYNMIRPENPDNRSDDTFSLKNPFDSDSRQVVKRGQGVNIEQTNSEYGRDPSKLIGENGGKGPPAGNHGKRVLIDKHDSKVTNTSASKVLVRGKGGNPVTRGIVTYKPKCDIVDKQALSALGRAKTVECRQQIADVACLNADGMLYAPSLPRYCPLKGNDTGRYFGCFQDSLNDRDLEGNYKELPNNSPKVCIAFCLRSGFHYAGLQYSKECWCGDRYGRHGILAEAQCDGKCPGSETQTCGGYLAIKVYSTGYGEKKKNVAPLVRATSAKISNISRIVFVLTLNGRQIRQVVRLIRTIYHPQHYYFIHVDERQEYMFRELLPLENRLANVHLTKTRFSTIWGGASLLQAHLTFMKELMTLKEWKWDYYINLSESDYPIKTVGDLTAFLTKYRGLNFLKSHGRDTPRFIQKQGLDQTFYECDNHLWRVGPRTLPEGIRIDGGSDWICLYREFVDYLITSKDDLITGLKELYKYTLLPAESFFHTVLQNSQFCDKVVDNNLHLTNWRRKQGCKCQYKHIVDWCGCSPNDFKTTDLDRLMNYEEKPTFFARKFEPIVNQEIINSLDVYLFGRFQQDMVALTSYWQNEYHHLDKKWFPKDAYLTSYHSFARLGLKALYQQSKSCGFRLIKLLEANVFYESDHFHGLLVMHHAEHESTGKVITMETHMHPRHHYTVLKPKGVIGRIQTLQVGTDFDPKELIFRNYAQLIGPYDEIALRHVWGLGPEFVVSMAWIDPINVVAASYDVKIPAGSIHVGQHKPNFNRPLRPGIWTVKLMFNFDVVAETSFLVTPLSFFHSRSISTSEIYRTHAGPFGMYATKDFSEFRDVLQVKQNAELEKQAMINMKKVGKDLENWIDSLVPYFWQVQRSCSVEDMTNMCDELQQCRKTSWSSRSPDPKSELSAIGSKRVWAR
ncbi:xylosyltransferase 2-like [Gigantopelta aegis]|uniref:xylosyltransferase 2-like n=1 Tax=Gigantopelta aegis TaxID=1735272 RepID=UPI001B887447|nr:xylosyltransferase 2-like [Gigantopelta aegis]XP_041362875.1 xylosyltransferase 2-like [Gigantopelta aegis]